MISVSLTFPNASTETMSVSRTPPPKYAVDEDVATIGSGAMNSLISAPTPTPTAAAPINDDDDDGA